MNKTKEYITDKIAKEIRGSQINNHHGITESNIGHYLCPPILENYIDNSAEEKVCPVWTVLEEHPETKSGYTIVYDPEFDEFGLGMHGADDKLYYLGRYGSLIETLNSM